MSSSGPSPLTGRPPKVEYTSRFVQPPSSLYIGPDDLLTLRFASQVEGVTARVLARILTPDEGVLYWRHDLTTTVARFEEVLVRPLMEGFLLGLNVDVYSDIVGSRWQWASVQISRGEVGIGGQFHALCQGYFGDVSSPLIWPGGSNREPHDGRGFPVLQKDADVAAGVNVSYSVPQGARARLMVMKVTLTTSATVANRRFTLEWQDNVGAVICRAPASIVQTAGQTFTYFVAPWGIDGVDYNGDIRVPWPREALLAQNDFLVTNVTNFQGDDDFGAAVWNFEEWHDLT